MATLLEQAFMEASKLPQEEQDALAERILVDLRSELRWNKLFEASQDLLSQWADEALAEHRAGKTMPVDCKAR